MSVPEIIRDFICWNKSGTSQRRIYVYCSPEFLDKLLGKVQENKAKKRANKPWYRKERW